MKMRRVFFFAVFLPVLAASGPAAILHIHQPHPLVVGSVIQFSVTASYEETVCANPTGSKVVSWYVARENGGWRSERLHGEADAGWQTLDFEETYTVTPSDAYNPNLCFRLYSHSGCWAADRPSGSPECLQVVRPVLHFVLVERILCRIIPGCPNCLMLDLGELSRSIGDPAERVQVVLLRDGAQVALLGEAGRGRRLPAQFKITLPADEGMKRLRRAPVYQLRVLGKGGRVLASGEVTLKIK
jgi:hypothetical protein